MKIGVAKEIKTDEYRVALTPAGALELTRAGHEVTIEQGAGAGSAFSDEAYTAVGAKIASADEVWSEAELLLKVVSDRRLEGTGRSPSHFGPVILTRE